MSETLDPLEEIRDFHLNYGPVLARAVAQLREREFLAPAANEKKSAAADALTRVLSTIENIAGGAEMNHAADAVLKQAPMDMKTARDVLREWYKPYFIAAKGASVDVKALQAGGAMDWRPVPG